MNQFYSRKKEIEDSEEIENFDNEFSLKIKEINVYFEKQKNKIS